MTLNFEKMGITVWVDDSTDSCPVALAGAVPWQSGVRKGLISKGTLSHADAESYIWHTLILYQEPLTEVFFTQETFMRN